MKALQFVLPIAALAALGACSSSNRAATATSKSAPIAYVDPAGVAHPAVTDTEARALAELPGGRSSWTSSYYPKAFAPEAFEATRQNSQTVAPGLVRQGTSVPMVGGGGTGDGSGGSSGAGAGGASGSSGGSGGGNR